MTTTNYKTQQMYEILDNDEFGVMYHYIERPWAKCPEGLERLVKNKIKSQSKGMAQQLATNYLQGVNWTEVHERLTMTPEELVAKGRVYGLPDRD